MDPEANPVIHLVASKTSTGNRIDEEAKPDIVADERSDKALEPLEVEAEYDNDTDVFPGDHGFDVPAYTVLTGSFLALFASFGLMVSIGKTSYIDSNSRLKLTKMLFYNRYITRVLAIPPTLRLVFPRNWLDPISLCLSCLRPWYMLWASSPRSNPSMKHVLGCMT